MLKERKMTLFYRTSNAFFVSPAGRRLQNQIGSFFARENLQKQKVALIGPVFPFLAAFEQNNPDIVFEKETVVENDFFSDLPPAFSIDTVFIVVLNASVAENLSELIKEANKMLKPRGRLFLLIKNKRRVFTVNVCEMPETKLSSVMKEIRENGFSLNKKRETLLFPYAFSICQKTDDFLFSLSAGKGCFSLLAAQKSPLVTAPVENYSSTRITKASVFTSPRT